MLKSILAAIVLSALVVAAYPPCPLDTKFTFTHGFDGKFVCDCTDGSKRRVISCTSRWTGGIIGPVATNTYLGTCFQKAGEICAAGGYTVLARSDEFGLAALVSRYGGFANTANNRMMIIRCNEGGVPAAAAQRRQEARDDELTAGQRQIVTHEGVSEQYCARGRDLDQWR